MAVQPTQHMNIYSTNCATAVSRKRSTENGTTWHECKGAAVDEYMKIDIISYEACVY